MVLYAFAQKSFEDVAVRGRHAIGNLWASGDGEGLPARSGFLWPMAAPSRVVGTMDVRIPAFKALVQGKAVGQGAYPVINTGQTTLTLPDNTGSTNITYRIWLVVRDNPFDQAGGVDVRFETVPFPTNSPSSTTSIPICQITVMAGESAANGGLSQSVFDSRPFTAAAGAVVPSRSDPGINAESFPQVVDGLLVRNIVTGSIFVGNALSNRWQKIYDGQAYTDRWVDLLSLITEDDTSWDVTSLFGRTDENGVIVNIRGEARRSGSGIAFSSDRGAASSIIFSGLPQEWRPASSLPTVSAFNSTPVFMTLSGSTLTLVGGPAGYTFPNNGRVTINATFMR